MAFLLVPLIYLVWNSFSPGILAADTSRTLENYREVFGSSNLWPLVRNSLLYGVGVCIIAVTIGGSLAWVGERTNAPLRGWLLPIGLMPLAIPGVLFTLSGVLMFSPDTGLINQFVASFTPLDGLINIYSMPGMIVLEGAQASPLAYLMVAGYLRSVDSSLEEAARVAGAGVRRTLRRITAPLGAPTLLGVLLLIFVRTIESFETPALIGIPARIPVFTSLIYLAIRDSPPNFALASAYSVLLVAITSIGIFLYGRVLKRSGQYATITGKGSAVTRLDLGPWRWAVTLGVLLYALAVVVMPVLVLVWSSLLPSFETPSAAALDRLSFGNYENVIARPDFQNAVSNTAVLAITSALIVSVIALAIAWITVRSKMKAAWVVDTVASVPLVVPGIVMGMAFLSMALNVPFPLYGTMLILILLHVTRFLPYGVRTATAGLAQVDVELEEAGAMAGAGWLRRMRKIALPLVLPTLFGGFLYAALLSVRELAGSIMVYTVDTRLFSILIFDYWQNGELGLLSAASVLVVIVLMAFVYLMKRLGVLGSGS
ncbi:ABC transporter permease [Mycolicibacterium iranicum]|uniref:ABC transporter permease n=1 Tax=Mycolicibacterium iranicum TaxID=912594 RepID=UPI0013F4F890|nr:iron ABC transporter permease [Mycolicibacterium iranicum]